MQGLCWMMLMIKMLSLIGLLGIPLAKTYVCKEFYQTISKTQSMIRSGRIVRIELQP